MTNRWIGAGFGYRVKDAADLIKAVGRIGTLQVGHRYVWRGAADANWSIQSSLQRYIAKHPGPPDHQDPDVLRQFEERLVARYRDWGLNPEGRELIQASLALMQHHSIPTRLLDVTSNPLTAAWFAAEPLKGTKGEHRAGEAPVPSGAERPRPADAEPGGPLLVRCP